VIYFILFIYLFVIFRQPNLSRLWTNFAEIWRADRKLV